MYQLPIPHGKQRTIAQGWLILAVTALAIAGLFSLPPVILRGPYFAKSFDVEHIFATALVIHVDMSVLIWMLSIGGLLWTLVATPKHSTFLKAAFFLAACGMTLIAASPFIGESHPLKNNYVPVLQNPVFFLGLSLFAGAVALQIFLALIHWQSLKQSILHYGVYVAALVTATALLCFFLTHQLLPAYEEVGAHYYYETLFWGGGHILQFSFMVLTLVAWLWLADACGLILPLPPKVITTLLGINLLIILPSPFFYLGSDALERAVPLFTAQMRYFGGISALFIGGAIVFAAFRPFPQKGEKAPHTHTVKASLLLSVFLFGYGGLLGYMISGVNVTIPAHYHGSIVSMTLAFMGLVYFLLPQLGFGGIKGRMATIQPYIYGVGQWMHITGLAWMGGYGALRKAPGTSGQVDNLAAKLMFFSGGSLAILGGLLFVIIAFRAILKKKDQSQ